MKQFATIVLLVLITSSCVSININKRHSRAGYFVQLQKSKKTSKDQKQISKITKTPSSLTFLEVPKKANPSIVNQEDKLQHIPQERIELQERPKNFIKANIKPTNKEIKSFTKPKKANKQKDQTSWPLYAFAAAIALATLPLKKDKAAKWAADNKNKARGIIGMSHAGILTSGAVLGLLHPTLFNSETIIQIASFGSLGLMAAENHLPKALKKPAHIGTALSGAMVAAAMAPNYLNPLILNPFLIVLLTLGLILATLFFSLFAFVLGCSIACSGAGVAGLLVMIFGPLAVLYFGILGILQVSKRESDRGKILWGKALVNTIIALLTFILLGILG